ncbi:MAG: hypothetical protein WCL14_04725 [Bacteroidota bacterium]
MTDRQLNYLRMVPVERGVLDSSGNVGYWSGNPYVVAAKANVQSIFDQILVDAGLTEADLHGNTTNKELLWHDTAEMGVHMNIGTKVWAENKIVPDPVLAEMMHYTMTDLSRGAIQEVLVSMNFILGKVNLIPVLELPNVNITPLQITNYTANIAALTLANPQFRIAQVVKSAATGDIVEKFVLLKKAMAKQDNLIHTYRYTHKVFVESYDNGRIIIDLGKTMKTEEAVLHPREHVAWFHQKYLPGDTLTFRNHSVLAKVKVFLNDSTDVPTTGGFVIDPEHEFKMAIPTDFQCPFGHYIIVVSLSDTDDANVTGILAKGKSASSAPAPPLI